MKSQRNPINARIFDFRRLAGYTQKTAAQALGMSENTYAKIECDRNPSSEEILRIAELFNVSVNEIFYGESEPQKRKIVETEQPTRLQEPTYIPKPEPPLILTANEKSIVKALKSFSKEDFDRVRDFVNEIYQNNKKSSD